MKLFKITEQDIQKIGNIIGEIEGKYCVPIIDILRALPEIAQGVEKVAEEVKEAV